MLSGQILRFGAMVSLVFSNFALADDWYISNMTTHFMGPVSGLPDSSWPEGTAFNSSIDFHLQLRGGSDTPSVLFSAACAANWTAGKPPMGFSPCVAYKTNEQILISWRFSPGTFVSESNFGIEVIGYHVTGTDGTQPDVTAVGSVLMITSNEPQEPSSYLTCTSAEPLAGVTCRTDGQLSSGHTPIPMLSLELPRLAIQTGGFDVRSLTADPYSSTNHQDCTQNILLELSRPVDTRCLVEWRCDSYAPVPDVHYPCQEDASGITFSVTPKPGATPFETGFLLSLRHVVLLQLASIDVRFAISSYKQMRFGRELVLDCGTSGHDRCIWTLSEASSLPITNIDVVDVIHRSSSI